jgi:hypothetical protein
MVSSLLAHRTVRFSTRDLTRDTRGRLDRWRLQLEHKLASRHFENERRVFPRPLEAVFPGIARTRAVIQHAVPGAHSLANAEPNELIILAALCVYLKPLLVMEFGTFDGLTALHFAMNSPPAAKVVTIDLHPDDPIRRRTTDDTFYSKGVTVGQRFLCTPESVKIEQVFCNTTAFDTAPYAGRVDLTFIDAGHAYELVRSDSRKSIEMLAPGGVILWHDYHYAHEGVYRWLNELSEELPLFQVPGTKIVCHVDRRLRPVP